MQWIQSIFSKDVSVVNNYMFRPPDPPSYDETSFPRKLIWIPLDIENYDSNNTSEETEYIPCLFIQPKRIRKSPDLLLIYHHANAEDLGLCLQIARILSTKLNCYVLVPEYPGYGIFPGNPCETSIYKAVKGAYEWTTHKKGLNWPTSNLIICGRSIGTGPATYIASQKGENIHSSEDLDNPILPYYNCSINDLDKTLLHLILKAEMIPFNLQDDIKTLRKLFRKNKIDLRNFESHYDLISKQSLVKMLLDENITIPTDGTQRKQLLNLAIRHELVKPKLFNKKCCILILLSGFASISKVLQSYVGDWGKYVISNRFDNATNIQHVKCPIVIVHGKADDIIPFDHSLTLWENALRYNREVILNVVEGMDHNCYDIQHDVVRHVQSVLSLQKIRPCALVMHTSVYSNPMLRRKNSSRSVLRGYASQGSYGSTKTLGNRRKSAKF